MILKTRPENGWSSDDWRMIGFSLCGSSPWIGGMSTGDGR